MAESEQAKAQRLSDAKAAQEKLDKEMKEADAQRNGK